MKEQPMDSFLDQVRDLSREQLVRLSLALREELLQLRPDEFVASAHAAQLYRTAWWPSPLTTAVAADTPRHIVLVTDAHAQPLSLPARNDAVRISLLPDALSPTWDPAALSERLATLARQIGAIHAVVYVPEPLPALATTERPFAQWNTALGLASALAQAAVDNPARLWLLTHQAHAIPGFDPATNVWHAALNGLGRSMSLECPARWGGCIDIDGSPAATAAAIDEILCGDDDEVAYRANTRFLPRLEPMPSMPTRHALAPRADGSYLLTGGSGGIARVLVEHLLARGARHLVLVTRHADRLDEALRAWRARYPQAVVRVVEADVSDAPRLAEVIAMLRREGPPLRGIFHAAGVNELVPLAEISPAWIDAILRAKVLGALHLDQLTRDIALDFQVYFSSIAGSWGTASMSLYAMASRFLDSLSEHRLRQGLPGCSIAWGPWADVGMIVQQKKTAFASLGLRLLDPGNGLAIIDSLAGHVHGAITAVDIDWQRYAQIIDRPRHLRLFAGLMARNDVDPSDAAATRVAEDALAPAAVEHASQVAHALRGLLEEVLAIRLPDDSGRRSLQDLGIDSLLSVELSQKITRHLRIPCRSTVAFDFPSLDALTDDLLARWSPPQLQADAVMPAAAQAQDADAIAIVGMACRLPGADSPQALWALLHSAAATGCDVIQRAPADRFDLQRYACAEGSPGKAYHLAGGYLEEMAGFDHARFGISRREAEQMDPQQRLALETTWQALEQAGLDPATLAEASTATDTSVFFGVGQNEYAALCRSALHGDSVGLMPTGQSMNIIAGRISHQFNFHGAAIACDTACSSSLVALDAAVHELRSRRTRMAVVGGVNVLVSPETFVLLSKAGALSRQGMCRAFDAAADGYVRAEGCVVLVLKRLADARADGDCVHAIVRGIAVNHDGRSSSLTAPNGRAQERVMRAALRDAGIEAHQVDLIEAHGTGTPLGDPIEYHALRAVYTDAVKRSEPLYVGTVKSLVGHTEAAAGLCGVLKLVLSLQNGMVPAQLHFSRINPHIDATAAIAIPARAQPLPARARTLGAVSAFGFNGTNAHAIIERGDATVRPVVAGRPLQRVRCWYTERSLAQSTGLAQAFAAIAPPAPDAVPTWPSLHVAVWQPAFKPPVFKSDVAPPAAHSAVLVRMSPMAGNAWHGAVHQALVARGIAVSEVGPGDLAQPGIAQPCISGHIIVCLDPADAGGSDTPERILDGVAQQYTQMHDLCRQLIAASARAPERTLHLLLLAGSAGFAGDADPHLASVLASMRKEAPRILSTLVEVDRECLPHAVHSHLWDPLWDHLDDLLAAREPMYLLSAGGLQVRRLWRLPLSRPRARMPGDRTLLLTGGLGGIGAHLLPALLAQGARYIVNFNRRPPSPAQAEQWARWAERYGAQIRTMTVDVTDAVAVEEAIAVLSAQMPPLAGVFHAAGHVEDGPFDTQHWDVAGRMCRTKFVGAWNLHRATAHCPVDHFVLFSSLASLLGNANQAGYALANSLLDRLAGLRRQQGLPALSVQWGPWAGVGMVGRHEPALRASYQRIGLSLLNPQRALDALFAMLAEGERLPAQVSFFDLDWTRYHGAGHGSACDADLSDTVAAHGADGVSGDDIGAHSTLHAASTHDVSACVPDADLVHARSADTCTVDASPAQTPHAAPLARMLQSVAPSHRARRLREYLSDTVIECLDLQAGSTIDPRCGFADLGIDSLQSTVLHAKIEHALGVAIPRSLAFDHPTIEALAEVLARTHLGGLFAPSDRDIPSDSDHLDAHDEDELLRILSRELRLASREGMTE